MKEMIPNCGYAWEELKASGVRHARCRSTTRRADVLERCKHVVSRRGDFQALNATDSSHKPNLSPDLIGRCRLRTVSLDSLPPTCALSLSLSSSHTCRLTMSNRSNLTLGQGRTPNYRLKLASLGQIPLTPTPGDASIRWLIRHSRRA